MNFLRRRAPGISDVHWQRLLTAYPFAASVGATRLPVLRRRCDEFLATKQFAAEAGLVLTDDIAAAIALQACLPVVELGLDWYDDFTQIIIYPDQFLVSRSDTDEAGVVHEEQALLAGEAIDGGPIVLSWADVQADEAGEAQPAGEGRAIGANVVIHEFVHKLDLRNGQADGIPPLPSKARRPWQAAIEQAFEQFVQQVELLEASLPAWLDPESEDADAWYAQLPLDPYAAQDPAEFFAVSGEAFFLTPDVLAAAFPTYFTQLVRFFGFTPIRPASA